MTPTTKSESLAKLAEKLNAYNIEVPLSDLIDANKIEEFIVKNNKPLAVHIISTDQVFEVFLAKNLDMLKEVLSDENGKFKDIFNSIKGEGDGKIYKEKAREIFNNDQKMNLSTQQAIIVAMYSKFCQIINNTINDESNKKAVTEYCQKTQQGVIEAVVLDQKVINYQNALEAIAIMHNNINGFKLGLNGGNLEANVKKLFLKAMPRQAIQLAHGKIKKNLKKINNKHRPLIEAAAGNTNKEQEALGNETQEIEKMEKEELEAIGFMQLEGAKNVYVCYDETNKSLTYEIIGKREDLEEQIEKIIKNNKETYRNVAGYCDFSSRENEDIKIKACLKYGSQFGFKGIEHPMSRAMDKIQNKAVKYHEAIMEIEGSTRIDGKIFKTRNQLTFIDNYFGEDKDGKKAKALFDEVNSLSEPDKTVMEKLIKKSILKGAYDNIKEQKNVTAGLGGK